MNRAGQILLGDFMVQRRRNQIPPFPGKGDLERIFPAQYHAGVRCSKYQRFVLANSYSSSPGIGLRLGTLAGISFL